MLVGDNSLVQTLRVLTSLELFFNANFYSHHPCFSSVVAEHSEHFGKTINNLLPKCVSMESVDTGLTKDDLVKHEAVVNCADKMWSSFLCICGLSSVLQRNIFTYYPDCGDHRYKLLFNRLIKPRQYTEKGSDDLHILFCYEGTIKPGETFQSNHFVPLLFSSHGQKRKSAADSTASIATKKRKVVSLLPKQTSKQADISNFFIVAEQPEPIVYSTTKKAPNETFSSAAALSAHNLDETAAQATHSQSLIISTNSSTKPQQSSSLSTTSKVSISEVKHVHDINKFDVSLYREKVKGMDTSEICNLIRNVFKPNEHYIFPKTNGRSFRYDWLKLYPWLCYSPCRDGAYCLSCVLFGDRFPGKAGKIHKLFSEPLTYWNGAAYNFKRHAGHGTGGEMGLHGCTFPILTSLLTQISGAAQPIEVLLDSQLKKEVEENRRKLAPIIDSVIFCSRLGLPLRGHRDDAKYHPEVGCYSTGGVGNFIESLNFRVRAGDKVLEDHLKTCGKNRSYISKTSQNKIIKCCGQVISDEIIGDIKSSKFFSVIADEAADSSHREQMSLVLRFVDSNMSIREEFIAFLHCKYGLSGAQLAKLLLDALNDLTLSIEDCRGQGYDRAGSVAGSINGLSAHILRLNNKALYTHSHRLNLSVCDSLKITEVTTMLKQVNDVSHFINSSQTRSIPFEDYIKTHSSDTETRKTHLSDICRTRWVERVEGMDTFTELFVPLYHTLCNMKDNVEGEFRPNLVTDANLHLISISHFEFVATLVITRHVLDKTLPVTQLLQGKGIDIMDGIHLINSLKDNMMLMRNSVDSYHDMWYDEALQLAAKVGLKEAKPRTVGKQTTRANPPFKTISEYYKRIITIPLIDHFNSSLQARFDIDSVNVYKGLSIVPAKMLSLSSNGINWIELFKPVATFYYDDLPNPLALDAELSLWDTYWKSFAGPCPSNIAETLKAVNFDGFENIKVVLRILGTLPITSCECERSISALRMLKDYKRSTMVEERLNGLALMNIHQEIVPDTDQVIDKFSVGNTRLKFS